MRPSRAVIGKHARRRCQLAEGNEQTGGITLPHLRNDLTEDSAVPLAIPQATMLPLSTTSRKVGLAPSTRLTRPGFRYTIFRPPPGSDAAVVFEYSCDRFTVYVLWTSRDLKSIDDICLVPIPNAQAVDDEISKTALR